MLPRAYLVVGLLALSLFAWGQYRGIGLFDDVAGGQSTRAGAGRTVFHK